MSELATTRKHKTKTLKAVLVGESTVGKTSILTVANTGQFEADSVSTVGLVSLRTTIHMGHGCIIYGIDSRLSFDAVENWYEGIVHGSSNKPHIYLIANKQDLSDQRQVSEEMGIELAEKLGAEFCEVSALADGKSVITLFEQMARKSSEQLLSTENPNPGLQEVPVDEGMNCC
jgi:GTPase SAR1 family protein